MPARRIIVSPQGGGSGGIGFSTTFPTTENPYSDFNGVQGGDVGLDWQNVQTTGGTPGTAFGTGTSATTPTVLFNDNICVFPNSNVNTSKQFAQMTVRSDAGYTPAAAHEVELLVLFTITAHSAKGYEMDFTFTLIPARWNGAAGDFTTSVFTTISGATFTPGDGDIVRCSVDGNASGGPLFTLTNNAVTQWVFQDQTAGAIKTGSPGMGFFMRPGVATPDFPKAGMHAYSCGNA